MQIAHLDEAGRLGAPMLEEIRRTAERRLLEIEPLIEEAERLRDVLAVIEERTVEPAQQPTASRPRQARPAARVPARGLGAPAESSPRAAKGANKRLILEFIAQRPGITPAEIAKTTGLKRTVVASTVSRLKRYGELCDHEQGGVRLPTAESRGEGARRGSENADGRPYVALVTHA